MRIDQSTIIVLALSVTGAATVDAEIIVKPEAATRGGFDTNPRNFSLNPDEVLLSISEAQVTTTYAMPTYSISLRPKFRLSRYTEQTELDSEDYFVELAGLKSLERQQYAGEFNYEREASIFTEQTDSGNFNANVPRTTFSLNGSWQYSLTDKLNVQLSGNALNVSFEDDPRSTLIGYQYYGFGSSLSYSMSDQTTWLVSFSPSIFKTPETGLETTSYAYQIGFQHRFDDSLDASFRIGNNISDLKFKTSRVELISVVPLRFSTSIVNETARSSGEIIDLRIDKRFARSDMRFEWNRSFSPSSQGSRQKIQKVKGMGRYRITRFFDARLEASYRERGQEAQVDIQGLNDQEILTFRGRLLYQLSRSLRAELDYQYQERKRLTAETTSDQHRVLIGLRFTPQEIAYDR
jgi:hypothetical protein